MFWDAIQISMYIVIYWLKEAVSLPTHLEAASSQTKGWSRLLCAWVGMWMWHTGWIQGYVQIKVYVMYLGFNLYKLELTINEWHSHSVCVKSIWIKLLPLAG